MSDLTAILLARISEDEAKALSIHAGRCGTSPYTEPDSMGRPMSPTCGCDWHISRVLVECEAKRRIVELHEVDQNSDHKADFCSEDLNEFPCPTLRYLALPYDGHPDYRDEWRP